MGKATRRWESSQPQGLSCLFAELPTELYRLPCVSFGDGAPRIARLDRIADEQAEGRVERGPKRLDANGEIQDVQQIMGLRDSDSGLFRRGPLFATAVRA